ncbi:hypothetical protein [Labrenzia sp. DG1229]|uniref:hypothetical protein n=1 Tax=Labrenzia sp. DG1229 TaxID=681847 RepID=UPI0012EB9D45|nr:hypothetical protein [Labrenzia sp. DG1229]
MAARRDLCFPEKLTEDIVRLLSRPAGLPSDGCLTFLPAIRVAPPPVYPEIEVTGPVKLGKIWRRAEKYLINIKISDIFKNTGQTSKLRYGASA